MPDLSFVLAVSLLISSSPVANGEKCAWCVVGGAIHNVAFRSFGISQGCQKCGTSSLYMNLIAHPRIWGPERKETFALNGNWGEPAAKRCDEFMKNTFMLKWFPRAIDLVKSNDPKTKDFMDHLKLGDFTTSNFHCGCCIETLIRSFPDLKVIVLLRDPIRRSISRYEEQKIFQTWYYFDVQKVANTPEQYLSVESDRIRECIQKGKRNKTPSSRIREECIEPSNIVGWSMYEWFISHILQVVPPNQLMWLYTEDMVSKTAETTRQVEEFLGLEYFSTNRSSYAYNSLGNLGWKSKASLGEEQEAHVNDESKDAHWERYCNIFRYERPRVVQCQQKVAFFYMGVVVKTIILVRILCRC